MTESIMSVMRQTYSDLELILIDDCSNDDTLARAHVHAEQDDRIKVISLSDNLGGGESRNAGISIARGQYIAFLDSDDIWEDKKLEIQLSEMKQKNALMSYTDYSVFASDRGTERTVVPPERMSYSDLLKNTTIGCSTVVYNSKEIGKRYFPKIRKRQDFGLWLSILRDIDFAHRCGPALTRYRVRPGSVSSNKIKAAAFTWRIYREVESLPLLSSIYYFTHHAIASVRRRL